MDNAKIAKLFDTLPVLDVKNSGALRIDASIQNPTNIRIIREQATVPVIVDAGVGTASDAAVAMELGADGVLMNTAIAGAADPVTMARAMRLAVEAGRLAYLSGRIPRKSYATASSPLHGVVGS